jgi:hypothetical protein
VRWDRLFDDLEAQLASEAAADLRSEVAERSRAEVGSLHLADRLRAHVGHAVDLRLRDGSPLRGTCRDVAVEWLVLTDGPAMQALVPLSAVVWVSGLTRAVDAVPGVVLRRLGLPHALRALARDRATVRLRLDGGEVTGTIDRVGADHVDLAEHPVGEARRPAAVRRVLSVRTGALLAVSSAG